MDHVAQKHCPICNNDLPVGSFGICRARRDGRNLYCKPCIRAKVTIARRNLKEYKAARKRVAQEKYRTDVKVAPVVDIATKRVKPSPLDRVRETIRKQPRTQREIRIATKLPKDAVTDILAELLLWTKEIRSELVGETRIYFFVEEKPAPIGKPSVLGGFSSVCALMPGKRAVG